MHKPLSRKELIERLSNILGSKKRMRALIEEIEGAGVLDVQRPPPLPKWLVYVPGKGHWAISYNGDDKRVATRKYLSWAGLQQLPVDAFVSRADEGVPK